MSDATHLHHLPDRRRALCCGAAAIAGLFTSLDDLAEAGENAVPPPWPTDADELLRRCFAGLDPAALWDVHAHLLGTGDSGSGCSIHPAMTSGWHPLERLRRRVIMQAAGVSDGSVDRSYVQRLRTLADGFPPGARWLLFAFDRALDDQGRERPDWTTFHVPDAYARQVAAQTPERFGWVASIHPLRADALARLDAALAGGARALKWLPSAMAIDLRDPRLRPFYDRLAATRTPLIVHCGEEKAVPGAGRDELGNPLLVRAPLEAGVRVVIAHCASLGQALDLDQRRPSSRPAFELFARLMDERAWRTQLLGDVSAVFQVNRDPAVWRTLLARTDWHPRLLHGSDYPLPGVGLLYSTPRLVHAGVLASSAASALDSIRPHNPLLFDFALKRQVAWRGQGFADAVFDTRRHFGEPARSSST